MECKDGTYTEQQAPQYRINRNILECKDISAFAFCSYRKVLIETYWNVKPGGVAGCVGKDSINRNILECKVPYYPLEDENDIGINRNILECKGAKE